MISLSCNTSYVNICYFRIAVICGYSTVIGTLNLKYKFKIHLLLFYGFKLQWCPFKEILTFTFVINVPLLFLLYKQLFK